MADGERLELLDEVCVPTEGEVELVLVQEDAEEELAESLDLRGREAVEFDTGERRPAPERERASEQVRGALQLADRRGCLRLLRQTPDLGEVELPVTDANEVPGRTRHERPPEDLAEPRHVALDELRGG